MQDEIITTIAKMQQQIEYIEKRQDKHDELVSAVHELASDVKVMSSNIEQQGRLFEQQGRLFNDIISKYDDRFKTQGERIGNTPTLKDFGELDDRVKTLEDKPLESVKQIKGKLMGAVATGVAGLVIGWLLHLLQSGGFG